MAIQLQFRRGTQSEWTSENPILKQSEVVIETDTRQVKLGDGATNYSSLPYAFSAGPLWEVNPFFMV